MTYSELVAQMIQNGCNLADIAVGDMMDYIADETGKYPDWDDDAPDWVITNCIGKKG